MPLEDGQTLSTVEDTPLEADPSPAQSEEPKEESQPISTLGDDEPKAAEEEKPAEAEKEVPEAQDTPKTPYHLDPRWQEIMEDRNYWRDIAQKAVSGQIPQQQAAQQQQQEEELDFTDITTMTPDKVRDWQEEDPIGYARNLAKQVAYESERRLEEKLQARERQQQQEAYKAEVNRQYDNYAAKNPEFTQMFQSGQLHKYMQENPGHNPISAHQLLIAGKKEGEVQEMLKKAKEEGRKEAEKNQQAKRQIRTISRPPERAGIASDSSGEDMLKDTKKYGGMASVITARLNRLRQKSA